MRIFALVCFTFILALMPSTARAQMKQKEPKQKEEDFARSKPAVGDELPDLTVYAPDGKEVKLSSLRGQYVVLTFGCLT